MNAHVAFCPPIGRESIDHIGESIDALPPNGGQRRNAWLMARRSHPDLKPSRLDSSSGGGGMWMEALPMLFAISNRGAT